MPRPARPALLAVLVALIATLLPTSLVGPASAATETTITGRVTTSDGQPVIGASIEIFGLGFTDSRSAKTDADGRFSTAALAGPHQLDVTAEGFLAFRRNGSGQADGPPVEVTAGSTTVVDTVLTAERAVIGGQVATSVAVPASVSLFRVDASGPQLVSTTSAGRGYYRFGVEPGTYVVRFGTYLSRADSLTSENVETVFWPSAVAVEDATPIVVAHRDARLDVGTTLGVGASVSGTVSSSLGGSPSAQVTTFVQRGAEWTPITTGSTRLSTWASGALPAGTYRFRFTNVTHQTTWSDDVVLAAGSAATRNITMTYIPEAEDGPLSLSGPAEVGVELRVVHEPLEVGSRTYQWQVDHADVPGATGSAYTPAVADLGKPLRVRVTTSAPDHRDLERFVNAEPATARAPRNLKVVRTTAATITLSWSPSSGADEYAIGIPTRSGQMTYVWTSGTTYVLKNVAPSKTIPVTVVASAQGSWSAPSQVTARTAAMAKPGSIKATKVTGTSMKISWTIPEGATHFELVRKNGSKTVTRRFAKTSSMPLTSLRRKTTYTIFVRAISDHGSGTVTTSSSIKVRTK